MSSYLSVDPARAICLTIGTVPVIIMTTTSREADALMEISSEERSMLVRIEKNGYTGGAYKRATFTDKVCRNKAERVLLEELCRKGLAEKGLGGTVAGDVYWACWLTQKGKEAIGGGR